MKKAIIFIVLGLVLAGPSALAAEFIAPENKSEANISTLQQEIHKNLYIAGAVVTVNSNTQGDLLAAGGVVTINGNTEKDLFVAGGNLNINGSVGENARIGGGNISVNAPVSGDLVIGGGNVIVAQKAVIGGDLVIGGGNVSIDSNIRGNVKIAGGNVTINGQVLGKVEVIANKSLTFGSASEVKGQVSYTGPEAAIVKAGAKIGNLEYTKQASPRFGERGGLIGMLVIGSLLKLLMLLAAALVFCWLWPNKVATVLQRAKLSPWRNLGLGVLVLIVAPILGGLLMITVVGMYLGMIVLLLYALVIIISSVLSLFYAGNLVWGWYRKDALFHCWRDLALGTVVLIVLGLIPIVGWLAIAVIWLITLGALLNKWPKKTLES